MPAVLGAALAELRPRRSFERVNLVAEQVYTTGERVYSIADSLDGFRRFDIHGDATILPSSSAAKPRADRIRA